MTSSRSFEVQFGFFVRDIENLSWQEPDKMEVTKGSSDYEGVSLTEGY